MSSLVRTIQKRILKRMGYTRQTAKVVMVNGEPSIIHLKKGEGNIIDPSGQDTGSRHYPMLIPREMVG